MKKSSGGNGSSFSKGKQLGSSEGTRSTDAVVSVNYPGMRAWPVFVKCLGDLWCPLNVNPASIQAEVYFFPSGRDWGTISAELEGSARVVHWALFMWRKKMTFILPLSHQVSRQAPVDEFPPLFPALNFCCQVCLYRQNSSVSCTPELCNSSRPGQAGKSVMWPLLCHLGSKPSATLGLCSSLPKVTHQLYGSVRSVPSILLGKATCSLAGSPEGSSRFVSVMSPCCTHHLVVSANAWLSLLSRVREGKFQISLFLCLPWFSQLHRGDNGSTETAKYLLVWVRILISRVLWKTDCGKCSNSKEESFML